MGNRMPIPRKRGRGSRYDYSLKSWSYDLNIENKISILTLILIN